jgi:5'-methylthioadenosine phosphorylase
LLLEASKSMGEGSGFGVQGSENTAEANPESRASVPFSVHDRGCYVCMEGPAFSTRAESLMHRLWGGDLIGMTGMPEAKLAREAEMSYALVSLVTDYDCWRNQPAAADAPQAELNRQELLREIIGNLNAATENAIGVIRRTVGLIASRRESLPGSPAQRALELAIWSEKGRIPPEEVQRLSPLWIKYFGSAS